MISPTPSRCRVCGCTQDDCSGCIERTGKPCHWVDFDEDLCSACVAALDLVESDDLVEYDGPAPEPCDEDGAPLHMRPSAPDEET